LLLIVFHIFYFHQEAAINQELEPASFSYTHRDVILYALGGKINSQGCYLL